MTRQVVLDTETTGLNVSEGHRIIEIGAVEVVERRISGRRFHQYLNPERGIDAGALQVHGIREEFLADKPRFAEIATELLEFLDGAELIIHNAAFDVGFLDHELGLLGEPRRISERCTVLDSLAMARERHPGQKNGLDALCVRYGVDNSARELHGALLDAEILAEVYLAMTGGQAALALDVAGAHAESGPARRARAAARGVLPVLRAAVDEIEAHERRLDSIDEASGGRCLWRRATD